MRYLILGQGKSGTTALYEAVCQGVEEPVYSLFEPKTLSAGDVEKAPGSVVVKALIEHWPDEEMELVRAFDRRVFMCRDPRDVMVSRLLYRVRDMSFVDDAQELETFLSALRAKERDPDGVSMTYLFELLSDLSGSQNQLVFLEKVHHKAMALWNQYRDMFKLLPYERFVEGSTTDVSAYLGFDVSADVRVRKRYRRVERTRASGDWKNWLTDKDRVKALDLFGPYMDCFGYHDWAQSETKCIAPAVSSEYVESIVRERSE